MAILQDENSNNKFEKKQIFRKDENLKSSEISYDFKYESEIRPKTFEEYIGQSDIKKKKKIAIAASKKRHKTLDHILLYGPAGLGKTTLASVIANEMNSSVRITSAPALERPRDIIGILMGLKEGDILFIDEIHRLNKLTEEILYSAMEDFYLDMTLGKQQSSKMLRLPLNKFTLVGATTKAGALSNPLRSRFGMTFKLEFYKIEELVNVIERTAKILEVEIEREASIEVAKRSRGTARIANRLVKRLSDFAVVKNGCKVSKELAFEAFSLLKIDKSGLDTTDITLLEIIAEKFKGGPVGIETLAACMSEDPKTIEEVYEPFLLQSGFLERTLRGRCIAPLGLEYLRKKTN